MNPAERFGPWWGVPPERQLLCAIDGCKIEGQRQVCPADGNTHHHGCVHYERVSEALYTEHGLRLRHGWGLLCPTHYGMVRDLFGRKS